MPPTKALKVLKSRVGNLLRKTKLVKPRIVSGVSKMEVFSSSPDQHFDYSSGYSSEEDIFQDSDIDMCSRSGNTKTTSSSSKCLYTTDTPVDCDSPCSISSQRGLVCPVERPQRLSVISNDSGYGICPVSENAPESQASDQQCAINGTGNGSCTNEERSLCSRFDTSLSFQKSTSSSSYARQPNTANIRDVKLTSQSATCVTRDRTAKAPCALSERNAVDCFAVSIWCRLSRSLQNRLDARDIADWLKSSEQALFAADWQHERVLTTSTVALLHMMMRGALATPANSGGTLSGRILQTDGSELKAVILACFYVVCSYSGQEITYPMWPYLATASEHFWSLTISLGLRFSRQLLLLNSSRLAFREECDVLAGFAHVDIRQCRGFLPKASIPESVGELLLLELAQTEAQERLRNRRLEQQATA